MPIDIDRLMELLRAGADVVPPPIIAMFLLAGPTAAWILYHFIVQPRVRRLQKVDLSAMWVCVRCFSVNDLRMKRCYRCDASPDETDLQVIETYPSGPPKPTMEPGLDLDRPGLVSGRPLVPILVAVPDLDEEADILMLPDVAAMTEVVEAPARRRSAMPSRAVPVGPAKPDVKQPRRAVVAGDGPAPDDSPAA